MLNCRMSLPRLAPIAARMAISRVREVAFASSRFATLAQAISSTSATAPSSSRSVGRTSPTIDSRKGTTAALLPWLLDGYSCSRRPAMAVIWLRASSSETPGLSRPTNR